MPEHSQKYHSHYSPKQLFDIVADVQKYPEFIPWVTNCRIHSVNNDVIIAELLVKFKAFKSSYTSKIHLIKHDGGDLEIKVELVSGPFKYLNNNWKFVDSGDATAIVYFDISFEFNSKIISKVASPMFESTSKKMVEIFEKRAEEIYRVK